MSTKFVAFIFVKDVSSDHGINPKAPKTDTLTNFHKKPSLVVVSSHGFSCEPYLCVSFFLFGWVVFSGYYMAIKKGNREGGSCEGVPRATQALISHFGRVSIKTCTGQFTSSGLLVEAAALFIFSAKNAN